jgi:hypothetical protein
MLGIHTICRVTDGAAIKISAHVGFLYLATVK